MKLNDNRSQLWAKGAPQKFSDYSVYKEGCFDKFHISFKFSKIKLKIDYRNIFIDENS
jgi:hypothetical protein